MPISISSGSILSSSPFGGVLSLCSIFPGRFGTRAHIYWWASPYCWQTAELQKSNGHIAGKLQVSVKFQVHHKPTHPSNSVIFLVVYFRYSNDTVTIMVRKNKAKDHGHLEHKIRGFSDIEKEPPTFCLQLQMSFTKRRAIPQLEWRKYSVRLKYLVCL